ncbi:MAG: acetyltransferase [Bacteroidia bacterium]|nr:MAG: acetyltransferase [Bacteroidia bacterium]
MVLYYIIYSILYLISLLPLSVLYCISDILAFLLYYIIRYRREVVRKNLLNSFPEKTLNEIIIIEKNFYRFFVQWIVEALKLLSISESELKKRCEFSKNFQEIFNRNFEEGKDILVLMGHLGNWEWAGAAFNLYFRQNLFVLYHPLSNKVFDRIMIKIRSRFGTKLLPMQSAFKYIISNTKVNNVYTFIADQCPSKENAFWMIFLNQETAVYYGPEKILNKIKAIPTVVFVLPHPHNKRGYYLIDAKELRGVKNDENTFPIMEEFMKALEENIMTNPSYWLWSHNRWKHKRDKF